MLTPVFSCEQTDAFVIVKIVLSAICKVLDSAFDINGTQFTFHCRPYYLRLKFNELLEEGKGERATYDLETNTLSVHLPKATPGESFTQLDNPAYLIATDLQRKTLITVVGDVAAEASPEAEEEVETEFTQTLRAPGAISAAAGAAAGEGEVGGGSHYGYASHFSGLFRNVDADIVSEMVAVPDPESTTAAARRALRLEAEAADFDEEAVLVAFEDEDGEVAAVLRYVPAHIRDFQCALRSDDIVFASLPQEASRRPRPEDEGLEEEETTIAAGGEGSVDVWRGNVAEFTRPLIEEVTAPEAAPTAPSPQSTPAELSVAATTRLAVPRHRPVLTFTTEENDALLRLKMPRLLFPPSAASVAALTVDLLLAEAYDDIVTEGQGCSETLWNLTTLSPSLGYLDAPDSIYDACVAFARRVLVYPLHRHFGVVQRVFAVVGTRLLLGRQYVVRALLRVRRVLAHSEHKHLLATIFLDPLIAHWMHAAADANERLVQAALELHDHATRTAPVVVSGRSQAAGGGLANIVATAQTQTLPPINLLTIGLPFEQ